MSNHREGKLAWPKKLNHERERRDIAHTHTLRVGRFKHHSDLIKGSEVKFYRYSILGLRVSLL